MPKPLLLFEHECQAYPWTDADLTRLERLNRSIGREILRATVRNSQKAIQASQHVGVIRFGQQTIQVLPKIYRPTGDTSRDARTKEVTANLLRLLSYAGTLPVREHEIAPLLRQTDDWFEVLTRLFATHLREEWQRGAHRTYQSVDDTLPMLKGKWRVADQVRSPIRRHLFSVTYDEFTADNPLNRIFRYVVERLWHLTRDNDNRKILGELRQWMEDVTLLPSLNLNDANASTLTRLTESYRPLLNLARLFLDGGSLRMSTGNLSTFAFLLDMNLLFESFIAGFMKRYASEIFPSQFAGYEFLPQSRGARHYLAWHQERSVFQTIPDIAFRNGNQFPLLIDTKYKRLDERDRRAGVAQSDFYQMHAYAHRYQCGRVVLLYPEMADSHGPISACFKLHDSERTINVNSVNICVDLSSSEGRASLIAELKQLFPTEAS
jgi:5-methylcytosine-specific restriction enzyme subunit McrC